MKSEYHSSSKKNLNIIPYVFLCATKGVMQERGERVASTTIEHVEFNFRMNDSDDGNNFFFYNYGPKC